MLMLMDMLFFVSLPPIQTNGHGYIYLLSRGYRYAMLCYVTLRYEVRYVIRDLFPKAPAFLKYLRWRAADGGGV